MKSDVSLSTKVTRCLGILYGVSILLSIINHVDEFYSGTTLFVLASVRNLLLAVLLLLPWSRIRVSAIWNILFGLFALCVATFFVDQLNMYVWRVQTWRPAQHIVVLLFVLTSGLLLFFQLPATIRIRRHSKHTPEPIGTKRTEGSAPTFSFMKMKRIHWIIVVGAVLLCATYVVLKLTAPPKEPSEEELRELCEEREARLHQTTSKLQQYLRCSVPAESSWNIAESYFPSWSVWVRLSTTSGGLATMRAQIDPNGWIPLDPNGWIPSLPGISIPVPHNVNWNPPSSNVWSKQETGDNTVRVWITAEDEGKMYYCQFVKSTGDKKPNRQVRRTE